MGTGGKGRDRSAHGIRVEVRDQVGTGGGVGDETARRTRGEVLGGGHVRNKGKCNGAGQERPGSARWGIQCIRGKVGGGGTAHGTNG